MNPPFSAAEFFRVFGAYNEAVWPLQVVFIALGIALPLMVMNRSARPGRAIWFVLGSLWVWMAVAYHWAFFTRINPAAGIFGTFFLAEGLLLWWVGLRGKGTRFELERPLPGFAGGMLIVYAVVVYPLLGLATGRDPLTQPSLGLPCPTTIFTLGLLLWVEPRPSWILLLIPTAWSIVGSTAVGAFGVFEDLALPVAALITWVLTLRESRNLHLAHAPA
jgi:hypothetical protein